MHAGGKRVVVFTCQTALSQRYAARPLAFSGAGRRPFPFFLLPRGRGTWSAGRRRGPGAAGPLADWQGPPLRRWQGGAAPKLKGAAPTRRSILALSVPGAASSLLRHLRRSSSDKLAAGSYCPADGFPDLPSPRLRAAAAGRQIPLRLQDRLENTAPHRARRACVIYTHIAVNTFCSYYDHVFVNSGVIPAEGRSTSWSRSGGPRAGI